MVCPHKKMPLSVDQQLAGFAPGRGQKKADNDKQRNGQEKTKHRQHDIGDKSKEKHKGQENEAEGSQGHFFGGTFQFIHGATPVVHNV
jgi:hypothetical protein